MSRCVREGTSYNRHRYKGGTCQACGKGQPPKQRKKGGRR